MNHGKGSALAGFGIALIWGLTFLSIKVAIQEFEPMTLALMRFIMATALVPVIALLTRTSLKVARQDMPILAASGFVGISLYFFFENNGILRLSASESSLIVGTIPVLTLLMEIFLYREKPKTKVILGILLSFLGVALIVLRSESARSSSFDGYLYMAGAAISWVDTAFSQSRFPANIRCSALHSGRFFSVLSAAFPLRFWKIKALYMFPERLG